MKNFSTPRGVLVNNKILFSNMYSHEMVKGILTDQTDLTNHLGGRESDQE